MEAPSPTQATTSPSEEQPVAVRPGAIDDVRVKASVYPVRRGDQTVAVNVMIESIESSDTFNLGSALSDGNPEVASNKSASVDGLRLVDPTNKKAYLPATTGTGSCLCVPADDGVWDYTSMVWVSVVFAAPPETVSAVDVQIPRFGTVNDVPIR